MSKTHRARILGPRRASLAALAALPVAACSTAPPAATALDAGLGARIERLEVAMLRQQEIIAQQHRLIAGQAEALRRSEAIAAIAAPGAGAAPGPTLGLATTPDYLTLNGVRGLGVPMQVAEAGPVAVPQVAQGANPDERARDERLSSGAGGGVLLRKGELSVEPGVEFVSSSSRNVQISGFTVLPAVLIGSFDVRDSTRDSLVSSVAARYGVTDRLEVDVRVPYVYRMDSTRSRPIGNAASGEEVYDISGGAIGDVEFGAHYQVNDGGSGWPVLVGNVRAKSTTGRSPFEVERDPVSNLEIEPATGTGFWSVEPSLTMIVPSDPAVFYANLSYQWNMAAKVSGAEIDPGDAIGFSFGSSLALNDSASLSFGGDFQFVGKTTQDGRDIPGADKLTVGRALLGMTYRFNDWIGLNLGFAYGITPDAPDAQLSVKLPIKFDLLK